MTWVLIIATIAVGFVEYYCAHSLIQKILKITENRAHLVLALIISVVILFPTKLIWKAFMITLFFTPLVLWVGFSLGRFKK